MHSGWCHGAGRRIRRSGAQAGLVGRRSLRRGAAAGPHSELPVPGTIPLEAEKAEKAEGKTSLATKGIAGARIRAQVLCSKQSLRQDGDRA